jgi:putative transposase
LLWADSHYGGEDLAEWIRAELAVAIEVVRRPAGQQGWVLLRRRWVVERSFAHLGRSRRLSKDYEARAKYSESLYLASIRQLVRRIAALSRAA